MTLSIRGRFVVFALVAIGLVEIVTALWLDARLRSSALPTDAIADLRSALLIAALGSFVALAVSSVLLSQMMSRSVRELLSQARRRVAHVAATRVPAQPRDELAGLAGSFNVIADDLDNALSTLAEERNRFEAVLETMDQGVLAVDRAHRIVMVNRAARQLLELPPDIHARPLLDFVRSPSVHELLAVAQEGRSATAELEHGVGTARRLRAQASGLAGGGVVVVLQDVTEIRRLETVRRDFVANVSHELRTPIAVIRANAETLSSGALGDPARAQVFVDALSRHAERLGRIVSDLLDISRIEAGRWEISSKEIALGDLTRRVIDGLATAAAERNIELVNEVGDDLRARADEAALDQVLVNLVGNAIKYTQAGGRVEIGAQRVDGSVRIEVADNGPGIDPKHRERIFERFYRVDPGRSRDMGGTGLGLAIVRHLVEAMGGRVGVDPRRPRGSVFWFTLRAATPPT